MTLTSEEVDQIDSPKITVEESTQYPGFWTWTDPSGFRRYRVKGPPLPDLPAIWNEKPPRIMRGDGREHVGRGTIVLLPPE